MPDANATPMFSVVIATRDRAALFERGLQSVLTQDLDDFEVIVVNDGSGEADLPAYRALEQAHAARVHCVYLPRRAKGHGPAFARNAGAALAHGQYLCFLDDDDLWIDAGHLRRCRESIAACTTPPDLYFTHQQALFADGQPHAGPLWLAGLEQRLMVPADAQGSRPVSLADLLGATSFAHLNCSIYRRSFYEALGGMDEALRYEEDRDLYLRAVDAAAAMLHNPAVVARHHIPAAGQTGNASGAASLLEKRIHQLRICDKAILLARQPAMREFGRRSKGYTLKLIAENLRSTGRPREALYYMREAMLIGFSFKWLAFTMLCSLQTAFAPRRT